MDSFFKAAVCDLDKLLDDFELNTDEPECKTVFLKPSVFPYNSLGHLRFSTEPSTVPPKLPDLNSLHYGSAASCPDGSSSHNHSPDDGEVKGQPLTMVDLLSSVDHGLEARGSAPPCSDRALKPVCDLVNDTSSAIQVRENSHDAFSELDVVENEMEEEEEEEEEEEALLVDFDGPVVAVHGEEQAGGYSASLSLLDVILPAAAERSCESTEEGDGGETVVNSLDHREQQGAPSLDGLGGASAAAGEEESKEAPGKGEAESPVAPESGVSHSRPVGLPSPPSAASVCGALGNSETSEDEGFAADLRYEADVSQGTEADSLMASEAREDEAHIGAGVDPSVSRQAAEGGRLSPEGQHLSPEPAAAAIPRSAVVSCAVPEPSTAGPPEFGFEYLPESDQAELLVTDEELDAFLQAHAEAEQGGGVPYCPGSPPETSPEPNGDQDQDGPVGAEMRSCGREDDLEGLAAPESHRTTGVSVEGGVNPGAPSPLQDSLRQEEPDVSPEVCRSYPCNGPDQEPSYAGARPKQLHGQAARCPPAGEEAEEHPQVLGGSTDEPSTAEHEETPGVAEEHSSIRHSSPEYAAQEHQEYSGGSDELAQPPPPYPGEVSCCDREGAEELGSRQPAWVPDSEAPNCMNCYQRFTFTRRRHHCRACGKVYCAACCNRKCKLRYLEKEARVCVVCFDTINRAQALERMMSPAGPSPNPNVPSEYCSTIPPLQQVRAAGTLNTPPPTVMVPVSVLKHPNNDSCPREQKRVWFADGILPNGEVADTTRLSVTSRRGSQESNGVAPERTAAGSAESEVAGVAGSSSSSSSSEEPGAVEVVRPTAAGPWDYALLAGIGSSVRRVPSLLPDNEEELPPLLITTGEDGAGDVFVEESPAPCQILLLLEEGGPRPLTFVLNANLLVNVKLVTYCGRQCWCFGSSGLQALGQRELVFLLECLPEEGAALPKDLFSLYLNVYQEAQKGRFLDELDNLTFTSPFLGSKDHAGMLFVSPTCQPLDGLCLPPQPFLFGLLIGKLEVPWAKVFPLRLLLRLGAEYNVYPTALTSVRFRDSVYRETGHTIMNLLADLRNYQYSLSVVEGLRIHMEMGHSYIDFPKSSFSQVQKVVNASNEHVISIGARFSSEADSHLVCFQNEDGNYRTQANSMAGKTRTVTGASFVVFNGALKASSGFIAKSSIVEDGLMVQIPPETMECLRTALREQTDFNIPCGRNDGGEVRENVTIRWVDWSPPVNTGKTSAVDGRPLDGVPSVRVLQETVFESDGRAIRCTEVFYQLQTPERSLASVLLSCSVFQKEMALAACGALTPHLAVLASSGVNSLALRISTQADLVEYQAGSGGRLLPQCYMNELDSALIPVIHGGGASVPQTAMDMEFIFYITHTI